MATTKTNASTTNVLTTEETILTEAVISPEKLIASQEQRRQAAHLATSSGIVKSPAAGKQVTPAPGAGAATTLVDNGGPILTNVHVQLIFWGTEWAGSPTPSATQVTNAVSNILAGPYMSALSQYRNVGRGSLVGTTVVSTSNPPNNPFSNGDVSNFISGLIGAGTVPNPSTDSQLFYCVIMPRGYNSTQAGVIGEHTFFTTAGVNAHFAWATNNGSPGNELSSVTIIFSHELVESATDPEGSAFQVNAPGFCAPSPTSWCEIGDNCQANTGTVNGVAVQSYWSQRDMACIIPNGLVPGTTTANPALIQSRFGHMGNFELVSPQAGGGMAHYWRNNDDPFLLWHGPANFTGGLTVDGATLIESDFGTPGNLEVVARIGTRLDHFWRDSGPAFVWSGPTNFATGAAGIPSLIQSRFGIKGNFELVTPTTGGGLAHYWRNNDAPGLPWNGPTPFAAGLTADAVTLIESNFGSPGNLEVVARIGTRLAHFWRDSGPAFAWNSPDYITV